jgi:hypothetical protein
MTKHLTLHQCFFLGKGSLSLDAGLLTLALLLSGTNYHFPSFIPTSPGSHELGETQPVAPRLRVKTTGSGNISPFRCPAAIWYNVGSFFSMKPVSMQTIAWKPVSVKL